MKRRHRKASSAPLTPFVAKSCRHREFKTTCPSCGEKQDRITDVGHGNPPTTGSLLICFACGSLNQLLENGSLQQCPESMRDHIPDDIAGAFLKSTGRHIHFAP